MTRSELVERLLAKNLHLNQRDVEASIAVIMDAIVDTLASGNRVEIRGFGTFRVNSRKPRLGRNPKTGEPIEIPPRSFPHFRPGRELRERVDR